MEPRFVIFRTENAAVATSFAHRLLWVCLHRPKAAWTDLGEWCEGAKRLIEPPADT
jgi:hypothetical protein